MIDVIFQKVNAKQKARDDLYKRWDGEMFKCNLKQKI